MASRASPAGVLQSFAGSCDRDPPWPSRCNQVQAPGWAALTPLLSRPIVFVWSFLILKGPLARAPPGRYECCTAAAAKLEPDRSFFSGHVSKEVGNGIDPWRCDSRF